MSQSFVRMIPKTNKLRFYLVYKDTAWLSMQGQTRTARRDTNHVDEAILQANKGGKKLFTTKSEIEEHYLAWLNRCDELGYTETLRGGQLD